MRKIAKNKGIRMCPCHITTNKNQSYLFQLRNIQLLSLIAKIWKAGAEDIKEILG